MVATVVAGEIDFSESPRASFDTREKDSRGPKERASMKEYSLSSLSDLPTGCTTASCEVMILEKEERGREERRREGREAGKRGINKKKKLER